MKYFASVLDYDFTANAEAEFDDIADGKIKWQEVLEKFYGKFHPLIEASEGASRAEAMKVREIGKDPKTGEPVQARFGRYGPVLQIGEAPAKDDKAALKPRFAPMPAGATIESVTLEQALPMFDLPRIVGITTEGEEITANIGPYGPYVKVGKKFISLKDQDPLTITEAQAREAIAAHAEVAAKKNIADFGSLKILRGPYGIYITDGKKNAKIPKGIEPEKLSEAEAQKILTEAPAKKPYRRRPKKS
jgi:DNA topoisomerase-1